MTVSSSTDRATFPGNGVATAFSLPFRFFANSDVVAQEIIDETGAVTPLTLGIDYALTGAGEPEEAGAATGVLTTVEPVPAGVTLFVQRIIPVTQPTDIVNQGRFFPEVHETVFDRLTMLVQQTDGSLSRSLRVQDYDPVPARLPGVTQRANRILSFDEDGNPVAIDAASDSSLVLRQELANSADPAKGAALVGYLGGGTLADLFKIGSIYGAAIVTYVAAVVNQASRTVKQKLDEIIVPSDSIGGKDGPVILVSQGNWPQSSGGGGRSYFFNPDAVDLTNFTKNSVVVLGGRGDSGYIVTVGPLAELAFHGGGGDTLLNHLAGTICGGAHHIMTTNSAGNGSHGFIGGGSYNENYGDYSGIMGGTLNKIWATKATIAGGDSCRIGVDGDRAIGRNGFIGCGYLNTIDGQYAWVPSGNECKATKDYSGAMGYKAVATVYGEVAQASGVFAQPSDAQTSVLTLRRLCSGAVATQLLADNVSQAIVLGASTTITGRALITATRTDGGGFQEAGYELLFVASNMSGALVIKSQALTVIHEDDAAWTVDVIASGSTVQIRFTCSAAKTARVVARVELVQVRTI